MFSNSLLRLTKINMIIFSKYNLEIKLFIFSNQTGTSENIYEVEM